MSILIIAEHDNSSLKPVTLNTVAAAQQIGGDIDLLVAGENCTQVAEAAAKITGIRKVLHADHSAYAHGLTENLGALIVDIAADYSHLLAPATTSGKNFMPWVAARLDLSQISEITAVVDADTFKRPIYAGNAIETVKSLEAVKVITVRATAFDAATSEGNAPIESRDIVHYSEGTRFVKDELAVSSRPELTTARVIVSGGRGMGNRENFAILETLADKLGGALGASRAAVDAGYVSNDLQVGQTGKIVAPELYIAVGISGAIQHLAGMKDSKYVVAINRDAEAPIFQVADYGLVADLFEAVPELEAKL